MEKNIYQNTYYSNNKLIVVLSHLNHINLLTTDLFYRYFECYSIYLFFAPYKFWLVILKIII